MESSQYPRGQSSLDNSNLDHMTMDSVSTMGYSYTYGHCKFELQCQNNLELILIYATQFSGQDLLTINHCRMFLHAIWVSDIYTGYG